MNFLLYLAINIYVISQSAFSLESLKNSNGYITKFLLKKTIVHDSLSSTEFYRKGLILFKQRDFKAAILSFDIAIMLKPDFAEAYNERANAKFDGNFWSSEITAWDDYETAIKFSPQNGKPYFDRGIRKNDIQNVRNANGIGNGCLDICKAYQLGFANEKAYYFKECGCK